MPDLDLEPGKNYRATPVKGEKAFAPGGLKRLRNYLAFLGIALIIVVILNVTVRPWTDASIGALLGR